MIFHFIENISLTLFRFFMIIVKLYYGVVSDKGGNGLSTLILRQQTIFRSKIWEYLGDVLNEYILGYWDLRINFEPYASNLMSQSSSKQTKYATK